MCRFRVVTFLFLMIATLLTAGTARAQDDDGRGQGQDFDTSFQFNLSAPGARSLAMGGAFLGMADDATAAYTNPAGLTNLALGGSEVAVEMRHWRFVNSFVDRGHGLLDGESPTEIGVDTVAGFQRDEAGSEVTGLSFLSFAYVMPRGLVLALYRHEVANFRTEFETQGPFYRLGSREDFPDDDELFLIDRLFPQRSRTDLEIVNYGVSAGFELKLPSMMGVESTLSLGLGASYYQLELAGTNELYDYEFSEAETLEDVEEQRIERQPGYFFGVPDFTDDNLSLRDEQIGDDDAFGINLGFLWKLGRSRQTSIGGVFRQGPDFVTRFTGDFAGTIHVPDVFGVGFAHRTAGGKTKIALDVIRVRYSQQTEDFAPRDNQGNSRSGFAIDDADQVHLGLERIFLVVESVFVGTARFGVWNDPFHELQFVGERDELFERFFAEFLDRPQNDEIHFSLGVGLVIKEDYQVDLAADLSDRGDTFSLSVVTFF